MTKEPEQSSPGWPVIAAALVLGIIVGTTLGAYRTQFPRMLDLLNGDHAAEWAGALGATLAACVAIGVGIRQHRETSRMLRQQIALDEKRYEREHIGPATAAYWRISEMQWEAFIIYCIVSQYVYFISFSADKHRDGFRLKGYDPDYFLIEDENSTFTFDIKMMKRIEKQTESIRSEAISGSIQLASALENLNAARRAATMATEFSEHQVTITQAETISKLLQETDQYLKTTCDELAKEFPAIRANVVATSDYVRDRITSNSDTGTT